MKSIATLFLTAVTFTVSAPAAEKATAGPKGGRWLETSGPRTEFLVTDDRKAAIHFYDAALKPLAPGDQVVAVTAEPKSGRVKVEMERTAAGFVSKAPLPESAEPYRVVVQVRAQPEARPQNFRIDLNLERCGECKLKEYACICEAH